VHLENEIIVVDLQGECEPEMEGSGVSKFRRLSEEGDAEEAMFNLYETLRWAENQPGAATLLIHDFGEVRKHSEHLATLRDKVYRSAAG
jgi:hypothetical protein